MKTDFKLRHYQILCFLSIIASLIVFLTWLCLRANLVSATAEIEQLRIDSRKVNGNGGENVIGQVARMNQKIMSNRASRKIRFVGWLTPKDWEEIQLIEMPK